MSAQQIITIHPPLWVGADPRGRGKHGCYRLDTSLPEAVRRFINEYCESKNADDTQFALRAIEYISAGAPLGFREPLEGVPGPLGVWRSAMFHVSMDTHREVQALCEEYGVSESTLMFTAIYHYIKAIRVALDPRLEPGLRLTAGWSTDTRKWDEFLERMGEDPADRPARTPPAPTPPAFPLPGDRPILQLVR